MRFAGGESSRLKRNREWSKAFDDPEMQNARGKMTKTDKCVKKQTSADPEGPETPRTPEKNDNYFANGLKKKTV